MIIAFLRSFFTLSIILVQCRQNLNLRLECFHSKFKCVNVNIRISHFEISRYFAKCDFFLPMVFSDGKGLSQLQLEHVGAYKKRFMPQNGQVAVLQCSPIWKKLRKSFKALSELKLKFIPKAWKREAMAHKTPFKIFSLKIEILTRLLFIFI